MTQTTSVPSQPDISFVVPVFNAAPHLSSLAAQVSELEQKGVCTELILVDDGSTDDSQKIAADLAAAHERVIALVHERNRGAGIARNTGWDKVRGRYTIFFDADDHLHADVIPAAIARLDATPDADCIMFAYRYERDDASGYTDMLQGDQSVMDSILANDTQAQGTLETMHGLLKFTNYPWNKIIRTAHYQQRDLRYGCTRVNNDILGHWMSLLFARTIILSREVLCTHVVPPQGTNLTNRFGDERLDMFVALNELYDLLEDMPDLRRRYAHHFWGLSDQLYKWAQPRLQDSSKLRFDSAYEELLSRINLSDYARISTKRAPHLADAIAKHLIA